MEPFLELGTIPVVEIVPFQLAVFVQITIELDFTLLRMLLLKSGSSGFFIA